MNPRRSSALSWGGLLVAASTGLAAMHVLSAFSKEVPPRAEVTPNPSEASRGFPTTIIGASSPPGIPTGEFDRLGNPVLANCATCHSTRPANSTTREGYQLTDFHQGLTTEHGGLQCIACHNPADYSQLRLAGGDPIEFTESLRLCAQCHGPQFRDYQAGAHGGMTGHWDRTRGARTRNHCLVCHDPHAPQYQPVLPVFKPRDVTQSPHPEVRP